MSLLANAAANQRRILRGSQQTTAQDLVGASVLITCESQAPAVAHRIAELAERDITWKEAAIHRSQHH